MKDLAKSILKFFLPAGTVRAIHDKRVINSWEKRGKPLPPPSAYKQHIVKKYSKDFNINTLIETGTYKGDMVDAAIGYFDRIYSIELDKALAESAQNKYKNNQKISIFQGDSAKLLDEILKRTNAPCVFWLDAHYSRGITAKGEKETPIMEELNIIFTNPYSAQHVILIDDARDFNGKGDYPSIETLQNHLTGKFPSHNFEVQDNIIRFHNR